MLNIDWHPGMIGQRFAERDIFKHPHKTACDE